MRAPRARWAQSVERSAAPARTIEIDVRHIRRGSVEHAAVASKSRILLSFVAAASAASKLASVNTAGRVIAPPIASSLHRTGAAPPTRARRLVAPAGVDPAAGVGSPGRLEPAASPFL